MNQPDCIFCKIVDGKIPSYQVAESTNFLAFFDVQPNAEGHTLVIPKKHVTNLLELPEYLGAEYLEFLQRVSNAITSATQAEGFNVLVRNGPAAGQEVFHLHTHILPRRQGDGLTSSFGPHKTLSPEQFEQLRQRVSEHVR